MKLGIQRTGCGSAAQVVALAWLFLGMGTSLTPATESGTWHIVSPAATGNRLPDLPPLAVVESRDLSGKTWQVQGTLPGTRSVAARDCSTCLERQGWRLTKVIPIGRNSQKTTLYLWRKAQLQILLMLFDGGLAKTGFALGLEDQQRVAQPSRGAVGNMKSGIGNGGGNKYNK